MRAIIGAVGLIFGFPLLPQANAIAAEQTQLLQPLSQWELVPSDTECRVERSYGDSAKPVFLGIQESPSRKSFRLIVSATSKENPVLDEMPGWISSSGAPIERWALHSVNSAGSRIDTFGLTAPEMTKLAVGSIVSLRVNGAGDGDFVLTGLPGALNELSQCVTRQRLEWRGDEPDTPATGIKGPRANVRAPFINATPAWVRLRLHPGAVQFIALVDETGKIAGCDVYETAGAPMMEELGCELLQKDVVAEPARDRAGKGIKDSFVTPKIIVK
jgi:hypothetical protein